MSEFARTHAAVVTPTLQSTAPSSETGWRSSGRRLGPVIGLIDIRHYMAKDGGCSWFRAATRRSRAGSGRPRDWVGWDPPLTVRPAKEVILWMTVPVALRRWRPRRDLQRDGGARCPALSPTGLRSEHPGDPQAGRTQRRRRRTLRVPVHTGPGPFFLVWAGPQVERPKPPCPRQGAGC